MKWLLYLFLQNQDAILSLPQEIKIILVISLAITIGTSLIKKAWRFAKIAAIVALIYFALSSTGVL